MLELVSVHIPKCGGTSLAKMLKTGYGWRFLQWRERPQAWNASTISGYVKCRFKQALLPQPRCIHGHFEASRFACKTAHLITFVRDPAERAMSEYLYIHRKHDETGEIANNGWRKALRQTPEEFMREEKFDFRHFADVDPQAFSFVGSIAEFDADMRHLARILEMRAADIPKENAAPTGTVVSDEIRAVFEDANAQEYAVYRALMARRDQIIASIR